MTLVTDEGRRSTNPAVFEPFGRSPRWLAAIDRAGDRSAQPGPNRIRCAKDSGLGRFPSREFKINQAWTQLTAIAADLIAWLRLLAPTGDTAGDLAKAEPKTLRYRLLHVPARLTHGARRRQLRLPVSWPWAKAIVEVFAKIAAIPSPG